MWKAKKANLSNGIKADETRRKRPSSTTRQNQSIPPCLVTALDAPTTILHQQPRSLHVVVSMMSEEKKSSRI